MRRFIIPLSLICTLLTAGAASSTTVIPPSFDQLVSGANTVFVGEVMNVRSRWQTTRQGRAIVTDVTFRVEDVWKGAVGVVTQLEFLGGTVEGRTMEVVGMPTFAVGQRAVLFVSGERAISPLVGFWHGRLRVERDPNGVDRVRTNDGRSLGSTAQVGPMRPNDMLSITPMRLSELKSQVTARAGQALARRLVRRSLGEGGSLGGGGR